MKQYHDLLQDVLDNGVDYDDRTGVGVRSVFGRQARYDLTQGFPLLTTKKTHMKSIVHELLWFLKGDTNVKYLQENGVRIWNEWASEEGDLGPVYGKQWRRWDTLSLNDVKIFETPDQSHLKGDTQGIGNLGDKEKYLNKPLHKELYQTWYGMLKRCYNNKHTAYENYGGKGIFVDERWLTFSNFYEDCKKLDNWIMKLEYPEEYTLDKDWFGSNKYGPDTCIWSSKVEQSTNINSNKNLFIAESPDGTKTFHFGLRPFCREYDLCRVSVGQVLKGKIKTNKGWKFYLQEIPGGKVARFKRVDQVKEVIANLKHNPSSRRIILTPWNVAEINRMALAPCHSYIQFKVYRDELSCQLYQRSADLFLGVPFNIASYSLLTHMLAQVTGLKPKEFVHTIGDAHIYHNHFDQTKELLSRDPNKYALPKLKLNPEVKDIFDFKYEDIKVVGYESYPTIKAKVAV